LAIAIKPNPEDQVEAEPTPPKTLVTISEIHWGMRLMSVVSLLALGFYTYVLWLCRRSRRLATPLSPQEERRRIQYSALAFGLDLAVSAYFGAATPLILKKGGLPFDRKNMPRPMFWFFAITGFVPTASMTLTVVGGRRWQKLIRTQPRMRRLHGIIALLAYFSWWIACSPVLLIGLVGEKRAIEVIRKIDWLDK
jgi:uncharacterized membrane protein